MRGRVMRAALPGISTGSRFRFASNRRPLIYRGSPDGVWIGSRIEWNRLDNPFRDENKERDGEGRSDRHTDGLGRGGFSAGAAAAVAAGCCAVINSRANAAMAAIGTGLPIRNVRLLGEF